MCGVDCLIKFRLLVVILVVCVCLLLLFLVALEVILHVFGGGLLPGNGRIDEGLTY